MSVCDGHGGWQVAELAMKRLHEEFNRALIANSNRYDSQDDWVQISLAEAHQRVENEFIEVAKTAYQLGFTEVARVGACALTAVVMGDTLYSANLGDSKGIIVNVDDQGNTSFRKINHMLNANSKKEQTRLRTLFTNDEDIVVCRKGHSGACYVKNRLQPTRALGDLRLKMAEFNNPNKESKEKGFATQIENFNGPYIIVSFPA
jgi:serine/threonine protein phosphatase PrpC